MPDFNLSRTAQEVDEALSLIDGVNNKLFDTVVASAGVPINAAATLANTQLASTAGQTLYHTGNTGYTSFNEISVDGSVNGLSLNPLDTSTVIVTARGTAGAAAHFLFRNVNGTVGDISTSGSSTFYGTSSDPRLKDFLGSPTDSEINDYFSRILDAAAVFTWKTDPSKAKVWGFDAHKAIDNGLHMGSEGEGPRDMSIGEVYQGAVFDDKGKVVEHEKKVTGARIDQSKDFAGLVFKVAQQDKLIKNLIQRLETLEGK